jgi:hypothetical protein
MSDKTVKFGVVAPSTGAPDNGGIKAGDNGDGTFSLSVNQAAEPVASSDTATAAANTAVAITLAAGGAGVSHIIGGIIWSYSAAPTGGTLTITDGGTTVFQLDITSSGVKDLFFRRPLKFSANSQVVITLSAAGASVVGKLNVHKWTEVLA